MSNELENNFHIPIDTKSIDYFQIKANRDRVVLFYYMGKKEFGYSNEERHISFDMKAAKGVAEAILEAIEHIKKKSLQR